MSARRPISPHAGARAGGGAASAARTSAHRPGPRSTGPASGSSGRATGAAARAPGTAARAGAAGRATSTRGGAAVERGAATTLPRLFTVRALVLSVVCLLAFVLLFPTVRAYLAQRADNARLVQQVAQARAANDDLAAELERWNDPAYVAAEARGRLAFVLPGETAFRVVDPEIVPDPTAPAVIAAGDGPALVPAGTTTPWYATIWESVRVAGDADVEDQGDSSVPAADPATEPTSAPTSTAPVPAATEPPTPEHTP